MNSKDILINNIKEWVKLENEIAQLNKEINVRKKEKKVLSNTLIETMKNNDIDCFDTKTGQICFNKRKSKKAITKKGLFDILTKYYNGDDTKINELQNFILDNRETITKETITLKPLL